MKAIQIHFRVIAFIFTVLILFQACTVYKSANVTLEEASKSNTKVRVEKRSGEKVKYSRIIVLNDGNFYGVKKENGMFNNILIDVEEIHKLQIKDQTTSTILTIAIPVIAVGLVIGGIALSLDNMKIF